MLDNATVIFGQDDFNTLSFMSNDLVNLVKFKLELSKYFYNLDKDGYINVVNEILSNDEKLILIILFYPQSEAEYQQILSDINYFNNLNQSHIYI